MAAAVAVVVERGTLESITVLLAPSSHTFPPRPSDPRSAFWISFHGERRDQMNRVLFSSSVSARVLLLNGEGGHEAGVGGGLG